MTKAVGICILNHQFKFVLTINSAVNLEVVKEVHNSPVFVCMCARMFVCVCVCSGQYLV